MIKRPFLTALTLAGMFFIPHAALAQQAAESAAQPAQTYGTGASAITEVYGDWTLACGATSVRGCAVRQVLQDSKTNQRVLLAELEPTPDKGAVATLIMPFGLRLSSGVRLQVGDVSVGSPGSFTTCYDNGCFARLDLDSSAVDLLKRGQDLKIITIAEDSGQSVVLTVSLAGFTSALDRGRELAQ